MARWLSTTDFFSKRQLRVHIHNYITHWNNEPTPFIWTNPAAAAVVLSHQRMLARVS